MDNKKIFCVTSCTSIGCTFLDWSIHYLSGQDNFFSTNKGTLPISQNPTQKENAHGHPKNHPSGLDETIKLIQELNKSELALNSLYPCIIHGNDVLKKLSKETITSENYNEIKRYQINDYVESLKYCADQNIPIVYVKMNTDFVYNNSERSFGLRFTKKAPTESLEQRYADLIDVFFKENFVKWASNNEFKLWDFREFLALNIRPHDSDGVDVDLPIDHFYLDSRDVWFNLEYNMIKIFEFLKLTINDDRFKTWLPIYHHWQKQHLKILNFCWNIDAIIDFTINNQSLDLDRYDLDIYQEAILQHELIYKHGLTIKGWGLEKFPNNTQDLYKLLEPNIYHPVDDIYNCLKRK